MLSLVQGPRGDPRESLDSISGVSYSWSTPLTNMLCYVLPLYVITCKMEGLS